MLPLASLGSTGLTVSQLTLSARSFAGPVGPMSDAMRPEDVQRAFHELGVRSFVVTPAMSEQLEGVKRLAREHREELCIISLLTLPLAGRVRAYAHRLARKLETDRLDVLLMGWVRSAWSLRESVWGAMLELKEAGAARAIGFSIHDRALANQLAHALHPDVMMIRYNAAHRGAEEEIFAKLPHPRPGIIAYTATRWGELLIPRPDLGFPVPMRAPECYAFSLAHPAVDTVLAGVRRYAELEEDATRLAPLEPERYLEVCRFGVAVREAAPRHPAGFMFPSRG